MPHYYKILFSQTKDGNVDTMLDLFDLVIICIIMELYITL